MTTNRRARSFATPFGAGTPKDKPKDKAEAARVADVELVLRFDADDAFFVVASGSKPMVPVLGGDSKTGDAPAPWAMTGAIWVDADGDGKALGVTGPR